MCASALFSQGASQASSGTGVFILGKTPICQMKYAPDPVHSASPSQHTHMHLSISLLGTTLPLTPSWSQQGKKAREQRVVYKGLETSEDLVRGNYVFVFILCDPGKIKPPGLVLYSHQGQTDRQHIPLITD